MVQASSTCNIQYNNTSTGGSSPLIPADQTGAAPQPPRFMSPNSMLRPPPTGLIPQPNTHPDPSVPVINDYMYIQQQPVTVNHQAQTVEFLPNISVPPNIAPAPKTQINPPPPLLPSNNPSIRTDSSICPAAKLKDNVKGKPTVEEIIKKQREEKAAAQQQRQNIVPQPPQQQPLPLHLRNTLVIESSNSQLKPLLPAAPPNVINNSRSVQITANPNGSSPSGVMSRSDSVSGYNSRRDSDDGTEFSDGRESMYSYRDVDDIGQWCQHSLLFPNWKSVVYYTPMVVHYEFILAFYTVVSNN